MPLSDILVCQTDEVEAAITSEKPYSIGAWFQAKNVGMIELCKLGEMLGVAPYDSLTAGFTLVGEPLPEGPWPQTVPAGLIAKIAALTDEEIAAACPRWAEIEEFGNVMPADDLVRYLQLLRQFISEHEGPCFLVNSL